ncbi:MAG: hypothetical protein LAT62_02725 [Natronospirillum sp.]|uniref:hypothetical protein n=1 Tax=Natronospirillum sp. TaxID=2812955 RepID=UPI0025E7704C|nr:hypothetical protein [Natronospirillum sp.]MCH8550821.1 hypothetical protein [Natronospirillum sp.]
MDFIITVSLVVLALVLMGAMAWMHVRYRNLQASREKLLQLGTENKKLQAMLRSLPDNFLSRALKDFIYRTLITNLKQMMELDRHSSRFLQMDLEEAIEHRRLVQANYQGESEHEPITDISVANKARAGLKSLYRYIKVAYEQRQITRQEAQALLDEIENRLVQTGAEFYIAKAQYARRQKRFREATALWRRAMETYGQSRLSAQYQQRMAQCRSEIRKLQEEWKEINRERNEAQTAAMQKEMDKWMEEEEGWKKKQLYDD